MITIIDYGVGNLGSFKNMLKKAGLNSEITNDPELINNASKIILPGVGSFDHGMEQLQQSGLLPLLNKKVLQEKVPVLGVCLGAQLMTEGSQEGNLPGLGWIKGQTIKFDKTRLGEELKIPHMGWSDTTAIRNVALLSELPPFPRFYFVHSYHFQLEDPADVIAEAQHGYPFTVAFARENVVGVQFHPEKSHKFGLKVLQNFVTKY